MKIICVRKQRIFQSIINYEHFEVYYFKIFVDLDKQRPSVEVEKRESVKVNVNVEVDVGQVVERPSELVVARVLEPVVRKKKTGCAGCNSKACTLL